MAFFASTRTGVVIALAAALVACDAKTPAGPTGITPTTVPTTVSTTTSVPGTGGGTPPSTPSSSSTSTATTTIPLATTRSYVAFGQVPPTVPSQLSLVLQGGPTVWTVLGFYSTPGGGAGQVRGQLVGNLDAGTFEGTLTSETPECVAERAFSGSVDPQFLRWTGGRTAADCKGSPLSFSSLLMLATDAPPPTSTVTPTTTTPPVPCGFSLTVNGVSVDAAGGQRSIGVTTTPTCSWAVQNFVEWITAQPTAGVGAGTVVLTIASNPGPPRNATVVIAGIAVVVSQAMVTTSTSTSTTTSTTTSIPGVPNVRKGWLSR